MIELAEQVNFAGFVEGVFDNMNTGRGLCKLKKSVDSVVLPVKDGDRAIAVRAVDSLRDDRAGTGLLSRDRVL
jgi:hypothetical protein